MITLKDIEDAKGRIEDHVYRTPCAKSEHFDEQAGTSALFYKMENLQRTGSFKERGALNKMLHLTAEERARGVITASAGNHAQGVAYHTGRLGIDTTIVMPERTPLVKVTSTRSFGARVVLHGNSFDEAYQEAVRIQQRDNRCFIHPFNDRLVMAGQGTIGLELLEQNPYLEMVVVPIGGGGMISGIAVAMKETNPRVQVVGVQTSALPSMKRAVDAGKLVEIEPATTIADGIAVKRPGDITFEVIREYVDEIVTVDEEEIANAILLLLEREKTVVEGAGAVGLAALLNGKIPKARGRKVAVVLSGGNIDMNVISRIIERGLVKDGRLVRLVVQMPDRPGTLARFVTAIGEQGANVVEIYHNRAFSRAALGEVQVEVTLETRGRSHINELVAALGLKGWAVREETTG
ncbi:MAG TPA: threonine ammonia-lyase [Myxococcaceae bacterium]|nr:threonine ammonia-lyase [Myxococcaceae bacterium]